MIPDKESWCDSLIPIVILEAIDVIRNQLRTPRIYASTDGLTMVLETAAENPAKNTENIVCL